MRRMIYIVLEVCPRAKKPKSSDSATCKDQKIGTMPWAPNIAARIVYRWTGTHGIGRWG